MYTTKDNDQKKSKHTTQKTYTSDKRDRYT